MRSVVKYFKFHTKVLVTEIRLKKDGGFPWQPLSLEPLLKHNLNVNYTVK